MTDDKFLMSLHDWKLKGGKDSLVCGQCGKRYRLPQYIFSPRDKICRTCELNNDITGALNICLASFRK